MLFYSDYIEFCLSEIAVDEEELEPELTIYYVQSCTLSNCFVCVYGSDYWTHQMTDSM